MMFESAIVLQGAVFGFFGGLVRFFVTSLKASTQRRVSGNGLLIYFAVAVIVGAFSGVLLSFGKVLAFLAGYAGLDLLDGYYKVFRKKRMKFG